MQQAFTVIISAVNLQCWISYESNIIYTINAFVNNVFLFIVAFHIVERLIEQNGEQSHLFLPAHVCR